MKRREMTRSAGAGRAAPPVRVVHLGLGNFHRSHQCWYTEHAPDAEEWGHAAFSGRDRALPARLTAQEGLYTLVTRAAEGDRFEVIGSLAQAYPGTAHEEWLRLLGSPQTAVVTVTVTEAGYLRRPGGGLDRDRPQVRADAAALRERPDAPVRTAPARLLAGLAARCRADAGPLALVSCDDLARNGEIAVEVVRDMAELVDPGLAGWLEDNVSAVTTAADRITPRTAPSDLLTVAEATGCDDEAPVVAEPFCEWVLCGDFPAGRPRWEDAGATPADDITPFEQRKLWLLNGAHSLLAYAGAILGRTTVAEAFADDDCREWVEQWWDEASAHLTQPVEEVMAYRKALAERLANPRIHHTLAQISTDGSQKLPVRILPVLRAERSAKNMPEAAARLLGAWVCHLRGCGGQVDDVRADELIMLATGPLPVAVRRVLDALDPRLGADDDLAAAVTSEAERFSNIGVR